MATRGEHLVCRSCGEDVRLYSLIENDGMVIGCGCQDIQHSIDSMPYEMGVRHTNDDWVRADKVIPDGEVGAVEPRYRDQSRLTEVE